MDMSRGSVIRIARSNDNARWQASSAVELPFAPHAVSVRRDARVLITLSHSLVSVGVDRKIQTLLPDAPWRGFYPNSSVLPENKAKVYIGMRQFVGEFDLTTKKFRLLIPSEQFLHKLPKEDSERIRKQYGD